MRIVHLMLSCFYIDNYNYQENVLPRQNKIDGHDVRIIASTETFINNIQTGFLPPGSYLNEDGIMVERIPYKSIINHFISSKLKVYPDLYRLLDNYNPDVIYCHGIMTYELKTLVKYKMKNPDAQLFLDSHADFNNSATNFLSKNILHRLYYKSIVMKVLPFIDKIFCINYEGILFLEKLYKIPRNRLVLYPLGGEILEDNIRNSKRLKTRKLLNIGKNEILLIHCAKMTKYKRTVDLVKSFHIVQGENLKLILIGSMTNDVKIATEKYIKRDDRINYLGWKNSSELVDYLCAADLFVQPGTQSATMQNALCYGCAAALYPYESHKYLLNETVFYIKTPEDMIRLFKEISLNKNLLEEKRKKSFELAKLKLDYQKLAAIIYS